MSPARMQLCLGAWIVTLLAVFYAFPAFGMYSWLAIGLSAAGAVLVGIRLHRPANRLPWYLLSAVVVSFTLGDTTYNVLTDFLGYDRPFPSLADLFYLAVYPMLAVALLVFIRVRSGADNRAALIDALVPTAGLGLLSWVLLIAPYVRDTDLSFAEKLTSVGYPLGDVLALAMLSRLLIGGGRKPVALHILSAGVVLLLVTDVVYGLRQLEGTWRVGGPVDSGWVLFYTAIALCALHPSMRELTTVTRTAGARTVAGGRRIAVMALAALIAPAVLLVEDLRGRVEDALMIAAASSSIFLLVIARVVGLIQAQRETAARERALRITGADLVGARGEEEVGQAVFKALGAIVPAGQPYRFHYHQETATPDGPTGLVGTGWVTVADLPAGIAVELNGFETALYAEAVSGGWTEGGRPRRTYAYLAGDPEMLSSVQPAFEALMAQGTLAIERIVLTDEINRRSSEDYFRALIQSASDVILIVDEDEVIRYASPSALPVFGRTDLAGTSLYRLIAGTDHTELRHLLHQVRAGLPRRDGVDLTAVSGDDLLLQVECTCRDLRDEPAVAGLVVTIRDVTERRRLENDLAHQAFHDTLTGLANRALLQTRLETAAHTTTEGAGGAGAGVGVGVVFVDLDNFKEVNDSLGHTAGDQLLAETGRRIAAICGPATTVARTGGDEFAVLLHTGTASDIEWLTVAIIDALAQPVAVTDNTGGRHLITTTASAGLATSNHPDEITELLRRADTAMYLAKTDGKNTWRRYHDELHHTMLRRLEMRTALNDAVTSGQMRLRFQPIVDLASGDVIAMEALVRWQHPTRGLLAPAEFIELSEETGAIVPIGNWVLHEALTTFTRWKTTPAGRHLRYISVNVSPRQFRTPGFVDHIHRTLTDTGAHPTWLLLEITESLVLHDAHQVRQDLHHLQTIGVRIAIDDFGTGYSSLSYLTHIPVDVLKIDKSFIADILTNTRQHALVTTIITLANTLNLTVIAEGIELTDHHHTLNTIGCHYGQGYLYSKPVTTHHIDNWLSAYAR